MPIEHPPLPYPVSALQPHLSPRQVELHHAQQRACVDALNAHTGVRLDATSTLAQIVRESQGALFELAAQACNQTFYWHCLRSRGGGDPQGRLGERIKRQFGDVARLREAFNQAALGIFGSGWAWLVAHPDGSLAVIATRNAGTPLTGDSVPLLACSVWEHAYYLDYQNDRARYLQAFWELVNWEFAESQLP